MRVLVTGGTGDLGRELVPRLIEAGHDVRVLSRRATPAVPSGAGVVQGDLTTGAGVEEAVGGADVIAHCATGARDKGMRGLFYRGVRKTDVEATGRLLDAARRSGRPHFLYISIVGVDLIPLGYYRAKLETEGLITSSGLPHTIFRTTQWHTLAWEFCRRLSRGPVMPAFKGFRAQLLDAGEVAVRMAGLVEAGPSGRADDMGGPEALTFPEVVRSYLKATGKRRAVVPMTLPGRAASAFREGHNLTPGHADGKISWHEWLEGRARA